MSKTRKEKWGHMICTVDEEGRVSKIEGAVDPELPKSNVSLAFCEKCDANYVSFSGEKCTVCEPPNAEDITVKFENKSKDRFLLYFHDSNYWAIERSHWGMQHPILYFKLLRDAEEAVNIIKRSV